MDFLEKLNTMPTEHISYRYEERDAHYTLRGWAPSGRAGKQPYNLKGRITERPEWLTNIVNAGLLAGAMGKPEYPPPGSILWFHATPDNEFLRFDPEFSNHDE
jgi:hypothetical protein